MEVLKQELRKIWRPGILLALALLGAMYYLLFLEFDVQNFPNGPYAQAQFNLAREWAQSFGATMEPAERGQLDDRFAAEETLFQRELSSLPEAAAAEITDYRSFTAYVDRVYAAAMQEDGQVDMHQEKLIQRIIGGTSYPILQELDNFRHMYDLAQQGVPAHLNYDGQDPRHLARTDEIAGSPQRNGYMPVGIYDATYDYSRNLTVWMVLSVVLLLSPTLVRDRLCRIRALQWTARPGREILRTQIAAACLSALLLSAVNLLLFGGVFLLHNGVLAFQDAGLFSLWALHIPWFDWTYGQYLLTLAGVMTALALGSAGLTVFLSRYSAHYVAMLLKALPLFVVLKLICADLLINQAFFFGNPLSRLCNVAGAEFWGTGLLLVLSGGLCVLACRRQHRRELMEP